MRMRIWVSDFGLTRQRGRHLWQMARESFDWSGLTSLIGRIRVEGMGVARWGCLMIMRESSSVG